MGIRCASGDSRSVGGGKEPWFGSEGKLGRKSYGTVDIAGTVRVC